LVACPIRVSGIGQNVLDVNDLAFKQDAPGYRSSVDSMWVSCDELDVFTREPVVRFEVVNFALRSTYGYIVRLAKARRRFDKGIEHGLEIEGRATDDLEYVGGGGLLLQRFPQLVEQARVLDGDDGLIRERLDQRELLGGEGSNLRPPHCNRANEDTFATHRHAEKGPDTAGTRSLGVNGTPVRIGLRIEDLSCPVLNSYAPDHRAVSWPNLKAVCPLSKPGRRIVIRGEVVQPTVGPKDEPLLSCANPRPRLD